MKTKRGLMTRVELPWTTADGRVARRISTMVDPMKAPAPGNRLPFRRGSVEYCLGTEADHEAVYQTLLHVFHGPDRESFLGALSDPAYRPDQRLLAKVDGRIVSHVHLTERQVPLRLGIDPDQWGDVGRYLAGVPRDGVCTKPDAPGQSASSRERRRAPGLDDRHAAVLPAARLGRLRPADVCPDHEPKPAPGERRRDRGAWRYPGTSGPGDRSSWAT